MGAQESHEDRVATLARQVYELQAELNQLRREGPRSSVESFLFNSLEGEVSLEQLFGDHDDLLVIHNMGRHCPYCTLWADGFIGMQPHFESRAALVVCSPDPPEVQQEFARSRRWPFRMVSDSGGFTRAMGYSRESDDGRTLQLPGFSTFRRSEAGIERVTHAPFGPGDTFSPICHMLGVLAEGPDGWQPQFSYAGCDRSRAPDRDRPCH